MSIDRKLFLAEILALVVLIGGLFLIITLLSPLASSPQPASLPPWLTAEGKRVLPTVTCLIIGGERESDLCSSLMERMDKKHKALAVFRVIDVKKEPDIARLYSPYTVPTVIIMDPHGKIVYQHSGYVDEEIIIDKLKRSGAK